MKVTVWICADIDEDPDEIEAWFKAYHNRDKAVRKYYEGECKDLGVELLNLVIGHNDDEITIGAETREQLEVALNAWDWLDGYMWTLVGDELRMEKG